MKKTTLILITVFAVLGSTASAMAADSFLECTDRYVDTFSNNIDRAAKRISQSFVDRRFNHIEEFILDLSLASVELYGNCADKARERSYLAVVKAGEVGTFAVGVFLEYVRRQGVDLDPLTLLHKAFEKKSK